VVLSQAQLTECPVADSFNGEFAFDHDVSFGLVGCYCYHWFVAIACNLERISTRWCKRVNKASEVPDLNVGLLVGRSVG
jgi:hypothetical protein